MDLYNYEVLKKVCAEKSVIRHISRHRNPDGSIDRDGNLKIWNDAVSRFSVTPLWESAAPDFDDRDPMQIQPSLIFVPSPGAVPGSGTILVACGGGFETRTGCEAFHVAEYFADTGFHTAILTYRLLPYSRYDSFHDMQRAIRLLRANKAAFGISGKVFAMGFSAGAMLSANCATHFDAGNPTADDPVERESCRPDGVVLGYGAFAFAAMPGFFEDPFAPETRKPFVRSREELVFFSPEVNIHPGVPPFFIWQTNGDDPRHSFLLGQALTAVGIPFEMHLFPNGAHGLALADGNNDLSADIPQTAKWAELCVGWLRAQMI